MVTNRKFCSLSKTILGLTSVLIILLTGLSAAREVRRCYWCGPLAEQVHRSRRAAPCRVKGNHITTCEPGHTHCAIVATSPPHVESRYCVKLYQDECYPLYCNSTKTWKMTCPCRGDLCNGPNSKRENEAFAVLSKLVSEINYTRIKKRTIPLEKLISQKNNNQRNIFFYESQKNTDITRNTKAVVKKSQFFKQDKLIENYLSVSRSQKSKSDSNDFHKAEYISRANNLSSNKLHPRILIQPFNNNIENINEEILPSKYTAEGMTKYSIKRNSNEIDLEEFTNSSNVTEKNSNNSEYSTDYKTETEKASTTILTNSIMMDSSMETGHWTNFVTELTDFSITNKESATEPSTDPTTHTLLLLTEAIHKISDVSRSTSKENEQSSYIVNTSPHIPQYLGTTSTTFYPSKLNTTENNLLEAVRNTEASIKLKKSLDTFESTSSISPNEGVSHIYDENLITHFEKPIKETSAATEPSLVRELTLENVKTTCSGNKTFTLENNDNDIYEPLIPLHQTTSKQSMINTLTSAFRYDQIENSDDMPSEQDMKKVTYGDKIGHKLEEPEITTESTVTLIFPTNRIDTTTKIKPDQGYSTLLYSKVFATPTINAASDTVFLSKGKLHDTVSTAEALQQDANFKVDTNVSSPNSTKIIPESTNNVNINNKTGEAKKTNRNNGVTISFNRFSITCILFTLF